VSAGELIILVPLLGFKRFIFLKIEDVVKWPLILLLPKAAAEQPVYASTFRKHCKQVVETAQPARTKEATQTNRPIAMQRNP
jgi:hypothetical protein